MTDKTRQGEGVDFAALLRGPDLPGEAVTQHAPAERFAVTPTHQATLEQWHAALAKAIRDRAIGAVPGILVRMALDGWGHEAEEARRLMLTATEGRP